MDFNSYKPNKPINIQYQFKVKAIHIKADTGHLLPSLYSLYRIIAFNCNV